MNSPFFRIPEQINEDGQQSETSISLRRKADGVALVVLQDEDATGLNVTSGWGTGTR
jgi:hypothetical protein